MGPIFAAILALWPWYSPGRAEALAEIFAFESQWYDVDPLLLVALAHVESGGDPAKSTGDPPSSFGLLQVHVSPASPRFKGREKLLLDPRTNVREGARILAMWTAYHARWCVGKDHDVIGHFKWGRRVGQGSHARRVRAIWARLCAMQEPSS